MERLEIHGELNLNHLANAQKQMTAHLPVGGEEALIQKGEAGGGESAVPLRATPENMADALKLLGFRPTPENLGFAVKLVENGLAVTAENMRMLNRGVRLTDDVNLAVFMMRNMIPVNVKNAEILKALSANELQVMNLLGEIAEGLEALPEGAVKMRLMAALTGENIEAVPLNSGQSGPGQPSVNQTGALQTEISQTMVSLLETGQGPEGSKPAPSEIVQETLSQTNTGRQEGPVQPQANTGGADLRPESQPQNPQIQGQTSSGQQSQGAQTSGSQPNNIQAQQTPASQNLVNVETPSPPGAEGARGENLQEYINSSGETVRGGGQEPGRGASLPQASLLQDPLRQEGRAEKQGLLVKILNRFGIDPRKNSQEEMNTRLNELREAVFEGKQILSDISDEGGHNRLFEVMDRLERCLDFFNELKRVVYVQIPFMAGDEGRNMGLYVFRDKGKKNSAGGKQSALLSLDFPVLGHFEAYIQKNGPSVTIRFKTEDEIRPAVAGSVHELAEMLESVGYRLDSYAFDERNEPFALSDEEPLAEQGRKGFEDNMNLDIKA